MRLLFDLDGTLTDPFLGITNCIQHALSGLGKNPLPADQLCWCIGPPLQESFSILLETTDAALIESAIQIYRERFAKVGLFENKLYSEIPEVLRTLVQDGHTLSVATSKPEVFARRIISHFKLDQYFIHVDGSQLDGTRSDKTSLISHILERDGICRKDAIMIGDRKHDIIGARANHITSIGVAWGHGSREELESADADFIAVRPADLPTEIKRAERSLDMIH